MSKASHPYFIANDPDRKTTAILLTGTADEFGIDQHDIQMVQGGFNVTEAMAKALYGDDFETDGDGEEETDGVSEINQFTPVVTGSDKNATATQPVNTETVEESEESDEEQSVAPEHQDHDSVDYASWEYDDLKAEVARRQIETENRRGETYIAALIQSDRDAE